MKLTGTGLVALAALAAVAIAGVMIWRNWPQIKEAFNPLSNKNVAYKATSAAVSAAVGREESLGGLLAEWFNPAARRVREMLEKPASPAKRVLVPIAYPGYSD